MCNKDEDDFDRFDARRKKLMENLDPEIQLFMEKEYQIKKLLR